MEERIARMKVRLSHIVKEYGYPNVEAFYKAFHKAETAYGDYQDSLKNWKQRYGEKPQSLHDRLKSKKQDITFFSCVISNDKSNSYNEQDKYRQYIPNINRRFANYF